VLNFSATRSRFAVLPKVLLALSIAASNSTGAHASALSLSTDCSASGDTLKCHLLQFLNLLYAAAAFLGVVLVIVLVVAFNSYRKSKKEPRDDS
jgi:hypothetical protein